MAASLLSKAFQKPKSFCFREMTHSSLIYLFLKKSYYMMFSPNSGLLKVFFEALIKYFKCHKLNADSAVFKHTETTLFELFCLWVNLWVN